MISLINRIRLSSQSSEPGFVTASGLSCGLFFLVVGHKELQINQLQNSFFYICLRARGAAEMSRMCELNAIRVKLKTLEE